jgi:putative restriction endonuclease
MEAIVGYPEHGEAPGTQDTDRQVRLAAFGFLDEQRRLRGDVLPQSVLLEGFVFRDRRVPLLSPQGIFKPAILPLYPLSFRTAPPSLRHEAPYADDLGDDGLIQYRYRGTDAQHRDNLGLRLAMRDGTPLIYLYGTVPGHYFPVWPVFIVGDDPQSLTFTVAVDERSVIKDRVWAVAEAASEDKRRYITREMQQRLHQRSFRERVLSAYLDRCAICRLRHPELLEASHILPDGHPEGRPVIPNGLSLCKLHHAAFDQNIVGIRPDYTLEVRRDVMDEHDGPMLRYGLQAIDGQVLHVPKPEVFRPNRDYLDFRYGMFRKAV